MVSSCSVSPRNKGLLRGTTFGVRELACAKGLQIFVLLLGVSMKFSYNENVHQEGNKTPK